MAFEAQDGRTSVEEPSGYGIETHWLTCRSHPRRKREARALWVVVFASGGAVAAEELEVGLIAHLCVLAAEEQVEKARPWQDSGLRGRKAGQEEHPRVVERLKRGSDALVWEESYGAEVE